MQKDEKDFLEKERGLRLLFLQDLFFAILSLLGSFDHTERPFLAKVIFIKLFNELSQVPEQLTHRTTELFKNFPQSEYFQEIFPEIKTIAPGLFADFVCSTSSVVVDVQRLMHGLDSQLKQHNVSSHNVNSQTIVHPIILPVKKIAAQIPLNHLEKFEYKLRQKSAQEKSLTTQDIQEVYSWINELKQKDPQEFKNLFPDPIPELKIPSNSSWAILKAVSDWYNEGSIAACQQFVESLLLKALIIDQRSAHDLGSDEEIREQLQELETENAALANKFKDKWFRKTAHGHLVNTAKMLQELKKALAQNRSDLQQSKAVQLFAHQDDQELSEESFRTKNNTTHDSHPETTIVHMPPKAKLASKTEALMVSVATVAPTPAAPALVKVPEKDNHATDETKIIRSPKRKLPEMTQDELVLQPRNKKLRKQEGSSIPAAIDLPPKIDNPPTNAKVNSRKVVKSGNNVNSLPRVFAEKNNSIFAREINRSPKRKLSEMTQDELSTSTPSKKLRKLEDSLAPTVTDLPPKIDKVDHNNVEQVKIKTCKVVKPKDNPNSLQNCIARSNATTKKNKSTDNQRKNPANPSQTNKTANLNSLREGPSLLYSKYKSKTVVAERTNALVNQMRHRLAT